MSLLLFKLNKTDSWCLCSKLLMMVCLMPHTSFTTPMCVNIYLLFYFLPTHCSQAAVDGWQDFEQVLMTLVLWYCNARPAEPYKCNCSITMHGS